jgi:hypothetical protein
MSKIPEVNYWLSCSRLPSLVPKYPIFEYLIIRFYRYGPTRTHPFGR